MNRWYHFQWGRYVSWTWASQKDVRYVILRASVHGCTAHHLRAVGLTRQQKTSLISTVALGIPQHPCATTDIEKCSRKHKVKNSTNGSADNLAVLGLRLGQGLVHTQHKPHLVSTLLTKTLHGYSTHKI